MRTTAAVVLGVLAGIAFAIGIVCLLAASADPDFVLVRIPRDQLPGAQKRPKLAPVVPIKRELEQPSADPAPEAGA